MLLFRGITLCESKLDERSWRYCKHMKKYSTSPFGKYQLIQRFSTNNLAIFHFLFIIFLKYWMSEHRRIDLSIFTQKSLINHLKRYGQLQLRHMRSLLDQIKTVLKNQANVLYLKSDIYVIGDIHGYFPVYLSQFYDLLNVFQKYGSSTQKQYLFLGDYVDRGQFSIQVITLLFFLKLNSPKQVHLLRGNHQSRMLTSTFNFKTQCLSKYNQEIYEEIMAAFEMLPLCAVIDQKYFAVHGGISPEFKEIGEIQLINRFREIPPKGVLNDLLWSDPIDDHTELWRANSMRQCSFFFGITHSMNFLNRNKLKMIIRGHQVSDSGYKCQRHLKTLLTLTIFSAPNYAGVYKNKACILQITSHSTNIQTFSDVIPPRLLPNFQDAIQWSLPLVQRSFTDIFTSFLTIQSKNLSLKLKETREKLALQQQLKIMERVNIITKILEMKLEKEISVSEMLARGKEEQNREQMRMDECDSPKRKCKPSAVIGPKIKENFNRIKSLMVEQDELIADSGVHCL